MEIKELATIEGGKIYILKYLLGSLGQAEITYLQRQFLSVDARLLVVPCLNLDDVRFEEKTTIAKDAKQ